VTAGGRWTVAMVDTPALLRLEIETGWMTDADGRLVRSRTPEWRRVPWLTVGAGAGGLCWALSSELPAAVAAPVADVLAATAPPDATPAVGWAPGPAGRLLDLLADAGALRAPSRGPAYLVPSVLRGHGGVELVPGGEGDEERLRGMMPERDRTSLLVPWTVALVDGQVAAVCETARSVPTSVEAGVWTYEPYRRRGLAAAVTAAWSAQVAERTAFYSTSDDNLASQGVARRLGLRPLGQWWSVYAA
jgi:RimJ/RimL family protein N-acetyltransferase